MKKRSTRLATGAWISAAVVAAALFLASASDAEARRARSARPRSKTIGLGLILGTPTGLSGEINLSGQTSLDLAVGVDAFNDRDLYVHVDYLVYLVNLATGPGSIDVPLYLGVGGWVWDNGDDNFNDHFHLGARVPFGIALALRRTPIQFFFELGLRVVLIDGDNHNHDRVGLSGGLGFRVYF